MSFWPVKLTTAPAPSETSASTQMLKLPKAPLGKVKVLAKSAKQFG
jgi:hypothetical protein